MWFARSAAFTIFLVAAYASAGTVVDVSCKATHNVTCDGAICHSEPPGEDETLPVSLALSTESGKGNLCTYSYCRGFVLVPFPGDTPEEMLEKLSGFTLSERRGSAGEDLDRPGIDYQLSISADHRRFFLGNLHDGGVSGWAGACTSQR